MAKIFYDKNLNIDTPTLILKKKDFTNIGNIIAYEIKHKDNFASANELSFKVYKYIDKKLNYIWDDINDYNVIYIPEYDEFYDMQVSLNEEIGTYKTVTCTALAESELSNTKLYDLNINNENDYVWDNYDSDYYTVFYKDLSKYDLSTDEGIKEYEHAKSTSLLHRILNKASHYEIGHVDLSLIDLLSWYEFSISNTNIYDELTGEIAEQYQCLFKFEIKEDGTRLVHVYDLCNTCHNCGYRGEFYDKCPECKSTNFSGAYGKDTAIFTSKDNLATSSTIESNKNELKNCFRVSGGDDLITDTLSSLNPNGTNDFYFFDSNMLESMPKELSSAIIEYNNKSENYLNEQDFYLKYADVQKYNEVIQYINDRWQEKDSNGNIKLKYKNITLSDEGSIKGYKNISTLLYETIDLIGYNIDDSISDTGYLNSSMMFIPDLNMDEYTIDETKNILITDLVIVAVRNPETVALSTVDRAVLEMAKTYINTALYKVEVLDETSYVYNKSNNTGTWTGKIKLISIRDNDIVREIENLTVEINGETEEYYKQKIKKTISKKDNEIKDIIDIDMPIDQFVEKITYYSKNYLNNVLQAFNECIAIIIESNNKELQDVNMVKYNERISLLEKEVSNREIQIGYIQIIQDEIISIQKNVKDELDFQAYLEKYNLWKIFCSYRREDSYQNDNYISDGLTNAELIERTQQLIDDAKKELYKAGTMQYTISSTLNNLLALKEFQVIKDDFECGNWIHVMIDDQVYTLRILSYEIDYDNLENISVEFSTVTKIWSGISDVRSILDSAKSIAGSYSSTIQKVKQTVDASKYVTNWVNKGMDTTYTKIVNNDVSQDIVIDKSGILCRSHDDIEQIYDPLQFKIIGNGAYLLDTEHNTVKTGIGKFIYLDPNNNFKETEGYGVIADVINSNIVLTQEVGIYSPNGGVKIDGEGITLDGGKITWSQNLPSSAIDGLDDTLETFVNKSDYADDLETVAEQLDKRAQTWYLTKSEMDEEVKTWTNKSIHVGDLWYRTDVTNGESQTFVYNSSYVWEAMNGVPKEVFDMADRKCSLYVSKPSNYKAKDIWILDVENASGTNSTYPKYEKGTLLVSSNDNTNYSKNDWIELVKYSSNLQEFIQGEYANSLKEINTQIDKKAETWYQDSDPSASWNTDELKELHVGDLWYNTKENKSYIYTSSHIWKEADGVPDDVYDAIDGKAHIFTSQPTVPYYEGDLYVQGNNGDIYVCQTERVTGNYSSNDWVLASKYTDDTELYNFIDGDFKKSIDNIKAQADKKAETWYQETDPSLNWNTEEKKIHIGDLWYSTSNEKTFIWNGLIWEETKSNPPSEVFDEIDGKAQIFVGQPKTPYRIGDLWFNSTTSDIMTCIKDRLEGNFVSSDWEKRNKYTDDAALNNFINNEYSEALNSINNQIDKKAETWYQASDPAINWNTNELKELHVGDLWYNTSVNKNYVYSSSYQWKEIDGVPDEVFDKIDKKAQIFTSQPNTPYYVNDLYVQGSQGDIYVCQTERLTGNYTSSDWVLASKYTDNSELYSFIEDDYADDLKNISTQIDGKARSWYQSTDPSLTWDTTENHEGDLWYNTNTNSQITSIYKNNAWQSMSVPKSVFDTIDGIASIYVTVPNKPQTGDLLIPTNDISNYKKGKVYKYNGTSWVEISYTDDTKANAVEKSLNDYKTEITNFQTSVNSSLSTLNGALPVTKVGQDYVISPKIGGGYLYITGTGGSVEINPNLTELLNTTDKKSGYIFNIRNKSKQSTIYADANGNANFNGTIVTEDITATGGKIGGWNINTDSLSYGEESTAGYMLIKPSTQTILTTGSYGRSLLTSGGLKFEIKNNNGQNTGISTFKAANWISKPTCYGVGVNSEVDSKFISFGNKNSTTEQAYATMLLLNYGLNPYIDENNPSKGVYTEDVIVYGKSRFANNIYCNDSIYFSNNGYINSHTYGGIYTNALATPKVYAGNYKHDDKYVLDVNGESYFSNNINFSNNGYICSSAYGGIYTNALATPKVYAGNYNFDDKYVLNVNGASYFHNNIYLYNGSYIGALTGGGLYCSSNVYITGDLSIGGTISGYAKTNHDFWDHNITWTDSGNARVNKTNSGTAYNLACVQWVNDTFERKSSDKRVKTNFSTLPKNIDSVFDAFHVQTYEYNEGLNIFGIHFGETAQHIETIFENYGMDINDYNIVQKRSVDYDNGEHLYIQNDKFHYINHNNIIWLCVDQIQKLKKRINQLEETVANM